MEIFVISGWILVGIILAILVLGIKFWLEKPRYRTYGEFLKTQFNKLSRAVYLLLTSATIICIGLAIWRVQEGDVLSSSLFIGLSASLGASLLTTIITQYFLGEDRLSPIKNLETTVQTGFKQITNLTNTTLSDFKKAESYGDYLEVFRNAISINMCFLTGEDEIEQNKQAIIQALNAHKTVNIILLHPDVVACINRKIGPPLSEKILFGFCTGKILQDRISWSLLYLAQILEETTENSKYLHIKLSFSIPMAHIIIVKQPDEVRRTYYVPYLQERRIRNSSMFVFTEGAGTANSPVEESFENTWKEIKQEWDKNDIDRLTQTYPIRQNKGTSAT